MATLLLVLEQKRRLFQKKKLAICLSNFNGQQELSVVGGLMPGFGTREEGSCDVVQVG